MTPLSRSPRQASIRSDLEFGFVDRSASAQHLYNPRLINNRSGTEMLRAIKDELRLARSFTFSVAFITSQAIATLKQALLEFEGRGTIITSDYLDFNDPEMFEELLLLDNIDVRVLDSSQVGFHAKGYLFHHEVGMTAIIGTFGFRLKTTVTSSTRSRRELTASSTRVFRCRPSGSRTTQHVVGLER